MFVRWPPSFFSSLSHSFPTFTSHFLPFPFKNSLSLEAGNAFAKRSPYKCTWATVIVFHHVICLLICPPTLQKQWSHNLQSKYNLIEIKYEVAKIAIRNSCISIRNFRPNPSSISSSSDVYHFMKKKNTSSEW